MDMRKRNYEEEKNKKRMQAKNKKEERLREEMET